MCKICVDSVRKYFPDCPETMIGDFLINNTCFPMGNGYMEAQQVKELRDKTDSYIECFNITAREMDFEMELYKRYDDIKETIQQRYG
jgi:hypothetical protein